MYHGNISCLIIVNGDRRLVRYFEDGILLGHSEGDFWILKYLDLHEMILRAQESTLEVSH